MAPGRVLVVAGSDCSGGAGLEADQKVLAAHRCYAMTATTALTVQNTRGVQDIHVVPTDFVERQMRACIDDIGVDVYKIGMLATAETIRMVSKVLAEQTDPKIVLDPVIVSTSGAQLLPEAAAEELIRDLFPLTTILTPNIPEAKLILSCSSSLDDPVELQTVADLEKVGRRIQALGPRWVLVKGGHLPFTAGLEVARYDGDREMVVDVLVGPELDQDYTFKSPWLDSSSTHGTGCSLASAIAAHLAQGEDIPLAVTRACRYVEAAIKTAPALGSGHGPLNHFHSSYRLPFTPGYFIEYLLERDDVKPTWTRFIHHPFVAAIGDGSIPLESFKGYIIQDYLYLMHFARVNAVATAKSKSMAELQNVTEVFEQINDELKLHIEYSKTLNIKEEELSATEEHQACVAYSRYMLDVAQTEDLFALRMALAPCSVGYGVIAKRLASDPLSKSKGNPYWPWVQSYVGESYSAGVRKTSDELDRLACQQSPSRIEEMVRMFIRVTKMEIAFWEMFPHS